jgi:hypothetical protein
MTQIILISGLFILLQAKAFFGLSRLIRGCSKTETRAQRLSPVTRASYPPAPTHVLIGQRRDHGKSV